MRIAAKSGHTLVEILIATALIGFIFLMITTLHVTAVKFLQNETNSQDVDSFFALETVARNASVAQEAVFKSSAFLQVQLRIDRDTPSTAAKTNDQWVTYGFVSDGSGKYTLRKHEGAAGAAAVDVSSSDPEVSPGLVVLGSPAPALKAFDPTDPSTLPTLAAGDPTLSNQATKDALARATMLQIQFTISDASMPTGQRTFITNTVIKSAKPMVR